MSTSQGDTASGAAKGPGQTDATESAFHLAHQPALAGCAPGRAGPASSVISQATGPDFPRERAGGSSGLCRLQRETSVSWGISVRGKPESRTRCPRSRDPEAGGAVSQAWQRAGGLGRLRECSSISPGSRGADPGGISSAERVRFNASNTSVAVSAGDRQAARIRVRASANPHHGKANPDAPHPSHRPPV